MIPVKFFFGNNQKKSPSKEGLSLQFYEIVKLLANLVESRSERLTNRRNCCIESDECRRNGRFHLPHVLVAYSTIVKNDLVLGLPHGKFACCCDRAIRVRTLLGVIKVGPRGRDAVLSGSSGRSFVTNHGPRAHRITFREVGFLQLHVRCC